MGKLTKPKTLKDESSLRLQYHQNQLHIEDINLINLLKKANVESLRLRFLDSLTRQSKQAKKWVFDSFSKRGISAQYTYAYPTKAAHFYPIVKNMINEGNAIECSAIFDVEMLLWLHQNQELPPKTPIYFNGFKPESYLTAIKKLIQTVPNPIQIVVDNIEELDKLIHWNLPLEIGFRLANDLQSHQKYSFRYSKLGIPIGSMDEAIRKLTPSKLTLKMLHIYIDQRILSEVFKTMLTEISQQYIRLKQSISTLDTLNIGGGMPAPLPAFHPQNYAQIIDEIVAEIQTQCIKNKISFPNLISEFGEYSVNSSGVLLFKIETVKHQKETESWLFLNNSFLNTLPDLWHQRTKFSVHPLFENKDKPTRKYRLAGLTCDGTDFFPYPVELPEFKIGDTQYIAILNTGAYQENLSGMGGLTHCMIPEPTKLFIEKQQVFYMDESNSNNHAFNPLLGYGNYQRLF